MSPTTFIITGASKGIGYALSKLVLKNQHSLIAISRSGKKLESLGRFDAAGKFLPLALDITRESSAGEIRNKLDEHNLKVDYLINNAGLLINEPFESFRENQARAIFDTNFFAPARLIRELDGYLQPGSHIVNIGSMGGFQGSQKFPGLGYYSASKAALASLTECIAEEYKEKDIACNCLCLGAVQTEMLKAAFPDFKPPLTAEEMAGFIYDFSVNGKKFFNGKVLPVSPGTP